MTNSFASSYRDASTVRKSIGCNDRPTDRRALVLFVAVTPFTRLDGAKLLILQLGCGAVFPPISVVAPLARNSLCV